MKYTPRDYQRIIIEHIIKHPRSAVWAGMGMGKTSATLYALQSLAITEPGPTLIIAPLRVAQSVWPVEVRKWDDFRGMTVSVITGGKPARDAALKAKADIYVINYDNLQWLIDTCEKLKYWPFTKIVCDESRKLAAFRLRGGARRMKALARVAFHKKLTRFIQLTGTPSPNGLQDLWGQLWFIDKGQRLGLTRGAFLERWFNQYGPHNFIIVPKDYAQREIQRAISDVCVSLRPEDWFKLDELVINDVPVYLGGLQDEYNKLESEMYIELKALGAEIEATSAAAKTIKCLQYASGAVYDEDKTAHTIHDLKLDALESILNEAAGPVLVVYHWKHDLSRLQKRFKNGRVLDKNPATIDAWNNGDIDLMFIHPQSAGHGLNLADGGNIIVFFSHWWDLEQYQQVIERIGPVRQLQAGHPRPVMLYNIRTAGTVDDIVIVRRQSKKSVQDILLESVTRRGLC